MTRDYFSKLTPQGKTYSKRQRNRSSVLQENIIIILRPVFLFVVLVITHCTNPIQNLIRVVAGLHLMMKLKDAITHYEDLSGGRIRTEICCANCDGHLGHVFAGEQITAKDTRHCVNSLSIRFKAYSKLQRATFGAGCFWSVEKLFKATEGVYLI